MNKQLIDVSHTVEDGMITYNGLPAPVVCDFLSREASREIYKGAAEFHIGKIEMVANTGTYVDAPFHRFADGKDLSELPLDSLADLEVVVVKHNHRVGTMIDAAVFQNLDLRGRAVLVQTGWDEHWRTETYFENHPYLTEAAARYLVKAGAKLVGIDSHNIDDTGNPARPAHTVLLGAEIPIVEHLCNLRSIPVAPARFFAVPVKVKNFGTFPVRAFCTVENEKSESATGE